MTPDRVEIASLLIDLEAALRGMNLWELEPPSEEALASTQPFAVDTRDFHQWLQFIFMPTIQHILLSDLPLPEACGVTPMAEEFFDRGRYKSAELLDCLGELDRLISEAD